MACLLTTGAAHAQTGEYYRGDPTNGDLWGTPGATFTFNTTTGVMVGAGGSGGVSHPFAFATEVGGGVQVFRFRNINLSAGVNINVQGSRPLVLAADRDLYISTSINVSGAVDGRGGGGIGGGGGSAGLGGAGGSGAGAGGQGGAGGIGGQGGGGFFNDGQAGQAGQFGSPGQTGRDGVAGQSGIPGSPGTNGFNIPGSGSAGGPGGQGGKDLGQGGAGGPGGQTGGGPGGGGSSGAGDGSNGGGGSPGGPGTAGFAAAAGQIGGNGQVGSNASFPQSPNTLEIYAGLGGGGGGGGGGGQGGGQGGGGGAGRGGGGGGGGGSGGFGLADGGNGGRGGDGGAGAAGAVGGAGGNGGNGGRGGNGGGSVILSARGLLQVTGNSLVNVSAGPISAGTGGTTGGLPGGAGTPGGGFGGAGGQSGDCTLFGTICGGNGGSGGSGGAGGASGTGSNGGQGGQGGNGGYGTPGMLKLHGSVILANNMELLAGNAAPGGAPESNGKMSFISNMTPAAALDNYPTLTPSTIVAARVVNAGILGSSRFDANSDHPYLPGLLIGTGPAGSELTEGVVRVGDARIPDYYLRSVVEDPGNPAEFTLGDGSAGIDGQIISGAENVFLNYEQIFVINRNTEKVFELFLQVDSNPPARIRGGTGELDAGEVWTTTIRTGSTVRLLQTPTIVGQPQDIFVFPGANANMTVAVEDESGTTLNFRWESNVGAPVFQPVVEDPTPPNGISGVGSNVLSFFDIQPPTIEGLYRVVVWNETGEANGVTSRVAQLRVYPPPTIIQEPEDARKFPRTTHVMTVEASGFSLNYQWYFAPNISGDPANPQPGTFQTIQASGLPDMQGALSNALFFQDIDIVHEGFYRCVVSNLSGSVQTRDALLLVERQPEIIQQPENVSVPIGFTATFTIVVRGTVSSYAWEVSDSPTGPWEVRSISIDEPNLVIPNAQPGQWDPLNPGSGDEGYYRCVVSGAGFGIPSRVVTLTVGDPGILNQPNSRSVNPGTNLNTVGNPAFTVVAQSAFEPLNYTWYKEATPSDIVMADGPEPYLLMTNIQEPDEGNYYVVITNSDSPPSSTESDRAFLNVNNPPTIIENPADYQGALGTGVQLRVVAQSDFPMTFLWYKQPLDQSTGFEPIIDDDGGRIQGFLSSSPNGQHTRLLEIFPSVTADEGFYRVEVNATSGSVFSTAARVILGDLLTLVDYNPKTVQKVYRNTVLVRFTTTTQGGLGARTYRWYVDRNDGAGPVLASSPIVTNADPFTASLEIINVQHTNAGLYHCEVSDSRPYPVETPTIELQVFDRLSNVVLEGNPDAPISVVVDTDFTFDVTSEGGIPPYTYEWVKVVPDTKAEQIVGVTSTPTFTLAGVQFEDAGDYFVRVSDSGTDVVSSNTVTLDIDPGIPAVSFTGLGLLAGAAAVAGAFGAARRRRK